MPSLRLRCFALAVRLTIRRRDWGSPDRLARRARRLFGAPALWGRMRTQGLRVTGHRPGEPPGEWIEPEGPAPVAILYLHGGGYVACSPATHRPITAALARSTPARVFALDYRLAPEHPHPAALDDATAAYRWLLSTGVSPRSLALAGDSAGGGLALALLLRLRDEGEPLPAGAVLLSPWTDLTASGDSIRANDGRDAMFRPENMADFAACYAPPPAWRDPWVTPLFGRLDGLPPIHLQVGEDELLRDDAVRLHDRIQAAGGSSDLARFEGVFHCWQMLDGLIPEAGDALRRASRFIAAAAAPEASGASPTR